MEPKAAWTSSRAVVEVGPELAVHGVVLQHVGIDIAGVYGVDPDAARVSDQRQVVGELGHRPLGVRVARGTGASLAMPGIIAAIEPMQITDAPAPRCGNAASTVLITPTRLTKYLTISHASRSAAQLVLSSISMRSGDHPVQQHDLL